LICLELSSGVGGFFFFFLCVCGACVFRYSKPPGQSTPLTR
jgi:hypothetical protein